MKRFNRQKYLWTNHDEPFLDNVREVGTEDYIFFEEVYDRYSTYDYAVDIRAVLSEVVQELLK